GLNGLVLTGTLTLTNGSLTITGTGTRFWSECRLGMRILAVTSSNSNSWLLVPKRIISDTQMLVWKAPDADATGVTGYRLRRLSNSNGNRLTVPWGQTVFLDKGNYLGAGIGTVYLNGSPLVWTLTPHPSLLLFNPTTETFTNFPLGMTTSVAPTLAAVGGG